MKAAKANPRRGAKFEDYLADQGLLEAASLAAAKRVLAWQIAELMKKQRVTKSALAKRMKTSRAALNRLLDETDTSLTLATLASAATALGKRLSFELVPA